MGRTTGARYTASSFIQTPPGVAAPGDQITVSLDILTEVFDDPSVDVYFFVTRSSGGDAQVGALETTNIVNNVVKRLAITRTCPANTTGAYMLIDGVNMVISPTVYTAVLNEISPTADSYFDGTVPGAPTSSWDGTAELSASTLTDTPPTVTGSASVDLGGLTVTAVGQNTVIGSALVSLGGLVVAANGVITVPGSATVGLGSLAVAATGQRTAIGHANINLGSLALNASAVTGGPIILPDDMYRPGPCHNYEYVTFCPIPIEAAAVSGYALGAASEIVYYASGQRFDSCQVTIRPCRKECYGDAWPRLAGGWWEYGSGPYPALINGLWYNIACGTCGTSCSCSIVSETILPGPVQEISQVTVDGEVLVEGTDYRLDDYRKLVRLGGVLWPLCNDLNKGITEVGTWSVTAIYGEPLPNLGKLAVGQLFCNILADLLNEDCALPANVIDITRQGLSFSFQDVQDLVDSGFTGLKYVDAFIQRYNPNKLMARARLYDVDGPDFRVTGTTI